MLYHTRLIFGALAVNKTAKYQRLKMNNVGPLAQLVEQLAFNQLVTGSNPVRPTK